MENKVGSNGSVGQEQIQDILFNKEIQWKEIIFDLINTEQLDPWDIDISVLADKFFEKIQQYEEMDFFISSKVLLAAALLLRIKSELILSKYLKSIDEILFGSKNNESQTKNPFERIELNEDIPELIMKSPLPRYRKVTLNELVESLNKAITTENRRIKKIIVNQNALRETGLVLPKTKIDIDNKIQIIHKKLINYFENNPSEKRISYTQFVGLQREEKILSFFPLLQLESNGDVWLEQKENFDEIYLWISSVFLNENPNIFNDLNLNQSELTDDEIQKLNEIDDKELL